ncbi:cytochrome C1 heme lyase [Metarhizium album ARSEF 1941]|uniref:Holocytochrome c-type synthase n=1 Tax=Metarhizium album (strain ARSEF 1941) TaxID=1081103 RepID=A0A0B2WIP9_METAS|nr:cytochrome C1 heme lyase [Metarhizium album ARSEF 1941]KHN93723.1 cytochrome C1 heme lyase [Metarhizium album ARSEF 1941]
MSSTNREDACPVDHKTRDAWLSQARAAEAAKSQASAHCPADRTPQTQSKSWMQTIASYIRWPSPSTAPAAPDAKPRRELHTDRAVSTIPRSAPGPEACPVEHGASANAANAETESGVDASGNWVYPSEKMFFDAMRRKGYDARAADMKTVVPIHNAVNERAWQQIKEWEAPYLSRSGCGGPKLASFANKSDRLTPTARLNTILGYTAPFDRHDWVIDRCGTSVEYVIDFYAGRPGGDKAGPSFYLDVRPKLNTWEGVKMRAMRWTGLA